MRSLEALSDPALAMLAMLTTSEGPHTPQRWSPTFYSWLAAAVASEQAKRDGRREPEPSFPIVEMAAAGQLDAAYLSAVAGLDSQKRVLPEVVKAELGRSLTEDEETVRMELVGFFRTLADNLLTMRRNAPAMETRH